MKNTHEIEGRKYKVSYKTSSTNDKMKYQRYGPYANLKCKSIAIVPKEEHVNLWLFILFI